MMTSNHTHHCTIHHCRIDCEESRESVRSADSLMEKEAPRGITMRLKPFTSQTRLTRQNRWLSLRSHRGKVVCNHVRLRQQVPRAKKNLQKTIHLPRRIVHQRAARSWGHLVKICYLCEARSGINWSDQGSSPWSKGVQRVATKFQKFQSDYQLWMVM